MTISQTCVSAAAWRRGGDGGCGLFPERKGNHGTRALSGAPLAFNCSAIRSAPGQFARISLSTVDRGAKTAAGYGHDVTPKTFAETKSRPARGISGQYMTAFSDVWSTASILRNVGPRFVRTTNWLSEKRESKLLEMIAFDVRSSSIVGACRPPAV
jgi:hypothetical protein